MNVTALKARQRRWATPQATNHKATVETKRPRPTDHIHPDHWLAIQERASKRRWPWKAMVATAGTASLAWGFTSLFATADIDPEPVAGSVSLLPLAIGFVAAWKAQDEARWIPDIAAGTVAAAGITFWTGMTGPTWWHAIALLIATVVLGTRWWKEHAVGPGEEPVWTHPAQPEPEEALTAESAESAPVADKIDKYVELWSKYVGAPNRAFPNSYLTGQEVGECITEYRVDLDPGKHNYEHLQANALTIAGGLGLDRDRLIIKKPPRGSGASSAVLKIITKDPVAEPRLYTGPQWNNGRVENLARWADGSGELGVKIVDGKGAKRIMVVGDSGGGKSAAANCITTGVMSSGLYNLVYLDPKGNSSAAMRKKARVAIIGKQNCLKAAQLIFALVQARGAWSTQNDCDLLLPSAEFPGLFVVHDEIGLVGRETQWSNLWGEIINTQRSVDMPVLGMNQNLHETSWGGDRVRAQFAQQVVAFRINSKSDDLVPGMEYRPSELPIDENGDTVPGMAVHAGIGQPEVPARWDWLPTDSDVMPDGHPEPPYRTSSAFEKFFRYPELHPVDVAVLEAALGPAVNGRWVVGPGGTHEFRDGKDTDGTPQPTRKSRGGFGMANRGEEQCRAKVLSLIQGGTRKRSDILTAVNFSEPAVDKALGELVDEGLAKRVGRGEYEAVEQD